MKRALYPIIAMMVMFVTLGVGYIAGLVAVSDQPATTASPAAVSVEDLVSAKLWKGEYVNESAAAVAGWYRIGIVQRSANNSASVRILFDAGVLSDPSQPSATPVPSVSPSATVDVETITSTPTQAVTVSPGTSTLTPSLKPPTKTPSPSLTSTSTATDDAPPQETLDPNEPTPPDGPEKQCLTRNLSNGPFNIRADHVNDAVIVGQVPNAEYAAVDRIWIISEGEDEWFHVAHTRANGVVIRGWMHWMKTSGLEFPSADTDELCWDLPVEQTGGTTPTRTPVPTQVGPTATPLPEIPFGCTVINNSTSNLNMRSGPGTNYGIIGSLKIGEYGQAIQTYTNGEEVWLNLSRMSAGGQNVFSWVARFIPSQGNLASLQGDCSKLPEMVGVKNTAGLHTLGFSVRNGEVLAVVRDFGFLKLTDDSYYLATEAKRLNPDILILHRSIHLIDVGLRNCPEGYGVGDASNAVRVAQSWWSLITRTWGARNLLGQGVISHFEVTNECGAQSPAWENAFWLETLRLAKQQNLCIALYSDSYGTPEIDQFVARRPVFDRILSEECRPGVRHIISLHTYGNVSSGDWIFGRWKLFRDALRKIDPKYDNLQYIFTEFGVTNAQGNNDGRGTADCGRSAIETRQAVEEYKKSPEVLGFGLYSVGGNSEWLNLEPCLPQIAAALQ